MMTKKIFINGMTCANCVSHVEKALQSLTGVKSVTIDLAGKFATLELSGTVADQQLRTAIEDEGYEVVSIE